MNQPHQPKLGRRACSVPEVADSLGLSNNTVWTLIQRGKLKATHIGRRTVLLTEDVENFLANCACKDAETESVAK